MELLPARDTLEEAQEEIARMEGLQKKDKEKLKEMEGRPLQRGDSFTKAILRQSIGASWTIKEVK